MIGATVKAKYSVGFKIAFLIIIRKFSFTITQMQGLNSQGNQCFL